MNFSNQANATKDQNSNDEKNYIHTHSQLEVYMVKVSEKPQENLKNWVSY